MNFLFYSYVYKALVDVSSPGFIFLLIILALIFILLVGLIIYSFIFPKFLIKPKVDNNIRVYSYNYVKKEFTYFDKMNLTKQRTFNEKEFLDQFRASDRYRVQDWLKDISQNKKANEYIQADIKINAKNHFVTSMMELTGYNPDACTIHFESHLLPFATRKPKIGGILARKSRYQLLETKDVYDFMSSSDPNTLGAFYYFKIYHLDKAASDEGDDSAVIDINKEIVDLLFHYTNKKRKIYIINPNEEVLIDNSSMSKIATMEMAYTLATTIQQHLNYKAPNSNLGVAIGITLNTFYGKDFEDAIAQSLSMVNAIISNLVPNHIALFDPQFYKRHKEKLKQIEQVKSVIKNQTIRIFFNPSFDIRKKKQSFYYLSPVPYGTDIKTFYDLLAISDEINNGTHSLLSNLIDRVKVISNNKPTELMLKIPFAYAKDFLRVNSLKLDTYLKWIILFEESDLITNIDNLKSIKETLDLFNSKGYKVALELSTRNSLLPSKIISRFSYFVISKRFTQSANKDPNADDLRVMQAEYSNYPGRLVYGHLKDFDDLEICAHYSGEIFFCDSLALPSSRLETISEDAINKCLEKLD